MGGFCKWWYIPWEDVATFPRINAATQYLSGEPALKVGKSWFGPIEVPRDKFGYAESPKRTKAGPFYEIRVEGVHIGDSPESRVNLENMAYHRYLIVGKVRAGGFYKLFGSKDSWLKFDPDYRSGNGPIDTAQTLLSFYTDHISKAYVMPAFAGNVLAPGGEEEEPGGGDPGGGGDTTMNQKEIIPFGAGVPTNIVWTPTRQNKFGSFPLIEVWLQDDPLEKPYLHFGGAVEVDAPPPATTEFFIKPGGNVPGFIIIG